MRLQCLHRQGCLQSPELLEGLQPLQCRWCLDGPACLQSRQCLDFRKRVACLECLSRVYVRSSQGAEECPHCHRFRGGGDFLECQSGVPRLVCTSRRFPGCLVCPQCFIVESVSTVQNLFQRTHKVSRESPPPQRLGCPECRECPECLQLFQTVSAVSRVCTARPLSNVSKVSMASVVPTVSLATFLSAHSGRSGSRHPNVPTLP